MIDTDGVVHQLAVVVEALRESQSRADARCVAEMAVRLVGCRGTDDDPEYNIKTAVELLRLAREAVKELKP